MRMKGRSRKSEAKPMDDFRVDAVMEHLVHPAWSSQRELLLAQGVEMTFPLFHLQLPQALVFLFGDPVGFLINVYLAFEEANQDA